MREEDDELRVAHVQSLPVRHSGEIFSKQFDIMEFRRVVCTLPSLPLLNALRDHPQQLSP